MAPNVGDTKNKRFETLSESDLIALAAVGPPSFLTTEFIREQRVADRREPMPITETFATMLIGIFDELRHHSLDFLARRSASMFIFLISGRNCLGASFAIFASISFSKYAFFSAWDVFLASSPTMKLTL